MTQYNLVFILNCDGSKLLTLYRIKEPYKGLYNLPGGKIEKHETALISAYRELQEETGISREDVTLKPFMDFVWHPVQTAMNVFIGQLHKDVVLQEECHPLSWHSLDSNFFDQSVYAGEGNIGHMVEIYKQTRETLDL
jgi:8-oxo-dGTP diphosphatase